MKKQAAIRRHWAWWLAMLVVLGGVFVFAGGRPPEEGTSDDRLYAISEQLKCLQCVGESVAGSQSPLAVQFRDEIREQMAGGKTDDEILAFFADRYGDEVLLDPPARGVGALAWLLPVVVAGGAVVGLGLAFTRWRHSAAGSSGPRIEEVVPVGARPSRNPAEHTPTDSSADPAHADSPAAGEVPAASGRWRVVAIAGGIGVFGLLVGLLLVTGSGERGDGEITGGVPGGSSGAGGSGIEECQPLAMSDPAAGIECYDELLESDPANAEVLAYRGWARVRAGDVEAGKADLEAALEIAPEYADPHVFLAIAAVEAGDFEEASSRMQLFWGADPGGVAVSVVQSEGLERKVFFGLMAAPTRACWQVAAQEAPEGAIDQPFLDSLAGCLDGVLAVDPTDSDARLSLALAELGPDEADPEAARSILDGLLREDPENSDALALLVSLDISQGELDAATDGLERLEELPRGPAAFLIGGSDALGEALAAAREASVPNPDGG